MKGIVKLLLIFFELKPRNGTSNFSKKISNLEMILMCAITSNTH